MKTRTSQSLDSIYAGEHLVQLYGDEAALYENLNKFIGGGLRNGDGCVVIATQEHISKLEALLAKKGFDLNKAKQQKKFMVLDAAETLAQFMVNGLPDKQLFKQVIGGYLTELANGGNSARAFGEMVALLWQQDNQTGAVLLEQLWNDISLDYNFTLFCAYPHYHFEREAQASALHEIANLHSSLILPKSSLDPGYAFTPVDASASA